MPFKHAISTLGCPELSLDEVLAFARRRAVAAVELRALEGSIDLPAVLGETYGAPASLAAYLQDAGVSIVSLDTSLKLAANTPAERDEFLRFLPWAEALDVPWLRVFDGGVAADVTTLQAMAATVEWWRALRAKHGWRADLMVETHDTLCTSPSIHQFLAAVPGTAILWDTHHTWKKGGEDPVATWQSIGAHIVHVHVKDSVGRPSARHPFTYVLPGDGEFPMAGLRPVLQAEYAGAVCLEWEKLWHPSLASLDEALAAAARNHWW